MTDKSNSDEPDSSASGNRPRPNIRRPKPRPKGLAGIASASNVDKTSGPVTRRPSTNVDKNKTNTNVDNPQAARPQQHTNVDKKEEQGHQPNTNVDNYDSEAPTPQSFQFPGAQTNTKRDPSKPKGPSKEVLERIQASKRQLMTDNRDLDQNKGASPSRPSPSPFANTKHTTISKKTSAQYLNRGRLLINRYKREQSIPLDYDDFDAHEFVLWLLSQKPTLKSSTWRVYRQAAYHTLQAKPDDDIEDALELLNNDISGRDPEDDVSSADETDENDNEPKRRSYRTSAKKEKRFPKAELEKYLAFLQYKSRSKLAPVLTDLLIASIYCGLRPIEWRATAFETSRDPSTQKLYAWLYVLNAKTTNARGNGLVRTLDLSDVPARILNAIKRTSERGLSWFEEGKYEEMQSQISQLVYQIGDTLYPRRKKHFSLYSCRHQFIANMKSVMEPEEVSALAGHVVTKTAQQNYGKKRAAWSPGDLRYHAKPIDEEVETVRKTASFYKDRIEKLKMAGLIHGNTDESWPT
ncbi:hypothetical protein [Sulfitobacter sp. R18_1]|uniref:hypothetical protein n=1 Tax=Sulfitobacter sp. R18_1 TaxID=2821104 RepID=UPI001ADB3870|nr:hypothetical protein [Sulfitobacter sp. R18_1]MBO9428079.1 hypothetical protein [Sulfitobacter sp. R18_1]